MNQCHGKSGWCSACNQWQIIIIVIVFLSLLTYGIFKLTQDPYRTIMGELCDLPKLPEPSWRQRWSAGTADSMSVGMVYYFRNTIADSLDADTTFFDSYPDTFELTPLEAP